MDRYKYRLKILQDDGRCTPPVGEWGYEKYQRVWVYDEIITTAMGKKEFLIYVDLFAGAGRALLKGSNTIVQSSPLLSLDLRHRFHRYIFCEEDVTKMKALRERVAEIAPDAEVHFVEGDVNKKVDEVRKLIPPTSLAFSFVDPYSINIHHSTLRELSLNRRMDFLILLAVQMDAVRNRGIYSLEESSKIDDFIDNPRWREEWAEAKARGEDFKPFLLDQYFSAMRRIGYYSPKEELFPVKNWTPGRRGAVPIYYLAFFSKNELGRKFWRAALRYSSDQSSLL